MEEEYLRKIGATIILVSLLLVSFFLLKPIMLSIVTGIILAFIFSPIYDWVYSKVKYKDLATSIVSIFLVLIIVIPLWFLTPILIDQSFKFFISAQQIDFVTPLKTVFPSIFGSERFSGEIGNVISTFVSNTLNSFTKQLTGLVLDFPTIALKFLVVAFTFYFVLRDKKELIEYIKSLLPFPKEVEKKLFSYSASITRAVIYGQILIGILQGVIAGIGFFII